MAAEQGNSSRAANDSVCAPPLRVFVAVRASSPSSSHASSSSSTSCVRPAGGVRALPSTTSPSPSSSPPLSSERQRRSLSCGSKLKPEPRSEEEKEQTEQAEQAEQAEEEEEERGSRTRTPGEGASEEAHGPALPSSPDSAAAFSRVPSYRAAVPHPLRSFSPSAVSNLQPPHEQRHAHWLSGGSAVGPSAVREVECVLLRDEWRALLHAARSAAPHAADDARLAARELVWRGVPSSLRVEVWTLLLQPRMPCAKMPAYMQQLWTQVELLQASARQPASASSSSCLPLPPSPLSLSFLDIEKDISRTLPCEWLFRTAEGVASLRRVLLCFAVHCPRVGYCQGLNFIAGSLLLACGGDEVAAFSLLCAVVSGHRVSYYTKSMAGCMVDTAVMADLASYFEPELLQLLQVYGLQVSAFCSSWLICLFCHAPLQLQHAMRVWDVLWSVGDELLFRLGLALLRHAHVRLLRVSGVEELLHLFLQQLGDMDSIEPVLQHVRVQWREEPHLLSSIHALRRFHRYEVTAQLSQLSAASVCRLQETTAFDEEELQRLWELFIRPRPWSTLVTSTITQLVHFRYSFIAATFSSQQQQRFVGRGLVLASNATAAAAQQPQLQGADTNSSSSSSSMANPPPDASASGPALASPSPSSLSTSAARRVFSSTAGPALCSSLSSTPPPSSCTVSDTALEDDGVHSSHGFPDPSSPSALSSASSSSLSSSLSSAFTPTSTLSRLPPPSALESHAALFVVPQQAGEVDSLLFAAQHAQAPAHSRQRSSSVDAASARLPASSSSWSAPPPLSYHPVQSTAAGSAAPSASAASASPRRPFPSPSTTEPLPSPPPSPPSQRAKGLPPDLRKASTLALPATSSSSPPSPPLPTRSSSAAAAGRSLRLAAAGLPSTFSAHRALSASLQSPLLAAAQPPLKTPTPPTASTTTTTSFASTIPLPARRQQPQQLREELEDEEDEEAEGESGEQQPGGCVSDGVLGGVVGSANVLSRLFAMLDGSGRGCVDFDEFCAGVGIWKKGTRRLRLMAAFRMADVRGADELSREDLRSFIAMLDALYHGKRCSDAHVDAFVTAAFEQVAPSAALDLDLFARVAHTHEHIAHFFKL